MANIGPLTPSATYGFLLQSPDGLPASTPAAIQDGYGNACPLLLSRSAAAFSAAPTFQAGLTFAGSPSATNRLNLNASPASPYTILLPTTAGTINQSFVVSSVASGIMQLSWGAGSGSGVSDHAGLSNLAYATSGHTGFAGTGVSNTFSLAQTFQSGVKLTSGAYNITVAAATGASADYTLRVPAVQSPASGLVLAVASVSSGVVNLTWAQGGGSGLNEGSGFDFTQPTSFAGPVSLTDGAGLSLDTGSASIGGDLEVAGDLTIVGSGSSVFGGDINLVGGSLTVATPNNPSLAAIDAGGFVRAASGIRFSGPIQVAFSESTPALNSTVTLDATSDAYQWFDPQGGTLTAALTATATFKGHYFRVKNSGATGTVLVKTGATTLATLTSGQSAEVIRSNSGAWGSV